MAYQSDTIVRLLDLREWFAQLVRNESSILEDGTAAVATQEGLLTTPGHTQLITGLSEVSDPTRQITLSVKDVVDKFEDVAALLDPLSPSSPSSYREAGFDVWDGAVAELKADVADFLAAESPTMPVYSIPSDRYLARLAQAITAAGLSPLGKFDASSQLVSADGCWRDWGDDLWWEVVGSEKGAYAPAFTNKPFYSCQPNIDGDFEATREFALQVNVKCVSDLRVGDEITLKIGNASWPATYQVGDELTLPVIAAHDLYLAGGQDGTTVQIWNVTGSVAGPMAPYSLDTASPSPYSSGGLGFRIHEGGVPSKVGDEFRFAIEGGHFKWRQDSGAWSADTDIPDGTLLLADGISVDFGSGNAPSFAVGDVYSFRILQPRRASNLQTPGPEVWKWASSSPAIADMLFDLGSAQAVANFALALHTLPAGCTLTLEGAASLASPWTPDWSETLTRVEGPVVAEFAHSARYLKLTIEDADGASIGWAFAGTALSTTRTADLAISRVYKVNRGAGGIYQSGRYIGKAVSGALTWTNALTEADVGNLIAMTDYLKAQDDQPIIVVPNIGRPAEAFLGQVSDSIDWPDIALRNAGAVRVNYGMNLPLSGVYFR